MTTMLSTNRKRAAAPGDLAIRLKETAAAVDRLLQELLPPATNGSAGQPARLREAMRYAAIGSGKKFRPFLVVESAALFDVPQSQALMVAAALECVHCYSLIHDDLPAMDDDALRRGQPTVHKQFDEATAILAGDGLLTLAFDILARPETSPSGDVRISLVGALAHGAGPEGMVGGQMLDLIAEGRFRDTARPRTEADVAILQSMKTGALIRFAAAAGAILAEADDDSRAALRRYGTALGQAFQIADDLLDHDGDASVVGKQTHKDEAAGKATLVHLLGPDAARKRLKKQVTEARSALAPFGSRGATLAAAADFVADRHS
jgi:farnesyl diphosphate synthase